MAMNLFGYIASLPEVGGLLLVAGGFIFVARLFRWLFAPSVDVITADLPQHSHSTQERAGN
ncbi:MAG: hypothetical protein L0Y56_19765 [Nitrospira sp.]|nr:hypothetical protein [Nitrospira sp.]